jgi:hypothetical protein
MLQKANAPYCWCHTERIFKVRSMNDNSKIFTDYNQAIIMNNLSFEQEQELSNFFLILKILLFRALFANNEDTKQ